MSPVALTDGEDTVKDKMESEQECLRSNHHQQVRVWKHPNSRVSRTKKCNQPPSAHCDGRGSEQGDIILSPQL